MIFLQSFIDAVCEHRELRSAKFFLEFLQISSSSKWSSTKKILDKQSNLNSVSFHYKGNSRALGIMFQRSFQV